MNQFKNFEGIKQNIDQKNINDYFSKNLTSWSRQLIASTHRLEKYQSANPDFYQAEQKFWLQPDDYLQHEPKWHQWGILTHTAKFVEYLEKRVPDYLKKWDLKEKVDEYFSQKIDGIDKKELFQIACWMHDLGKFTARTIELDKNNRFDFSFKNHEVDSGQIICSPQFVTRLKDDLGLNSTQIEYIANCAELHFVLGTLRNEAKKTSLGYTIGFAQSDIFQEKAKQIIDRYPSMAMEIGISFLADTLAKHELHLEADTDEEVSKQENFAINELAKQNLHPKLIKGVLQLPANLAVIRKYLELCLEKKEWLI